MTTCNDCDTWRSEGLRLPVRSYYCLPLDGMKGRRSFAFFFCKTGIEWGGFRRDLIGWALPPCSVFFTTGIEDCGNLFPILTASSLLPLTGVLLLKDSCDRLWSCSSFPLPSLSSGWVPGTVTTGVVSTGAPSIDPVDVHTFPIRSLRGTWRSG